MKIEIICKGCVDCMVVRKKICQALADLNLNADVLSVFEPNRMRVRNLYDQPEIRIDGQSVITSHSCTVKELKGLIDERTV